MAALWCEYCAAPIEPEKNKRYVKCSYCGNTTKLPNSNFGMYERAYQFRRIDKDFEGAERIYEKILFDSPEESAAHWGMVLSVYGIEYVDEEGRYYPTCHRIIERSILEHSDYIKALEYAESEQERREYENQAKLIDRYQGRIKKLDANTEPCDVFICFKDTKDENLTLDKMYAQKLYEYLKNELNIRTFYSPVSLNVEIGEYEPLIYVALNRAKIMIVLTSCAENLNAPWVKNEWSRFFRMYSSVDSFKEHKNMSVALVGNIRVEELPSELSKFQAVRLDHDDNLKKLCLKIDKELKSIKEGYSTIEKHGATITERQERIEGILELANAYRKEGFFKDAKEKYNDILVESTTEATKKYRTDGHWGMLLCELKIMDKTTQIKKLISDIKNMRGYEKAVRMSNDDRRTQHYQNLIENACFDHEKQHAQMRYDKQCKKIVKYYTDGIYEEELISSASKKAADKIDEAVREQKDVKEMLDYVEEQFLKSRYFITNVLLYLSIFALYPFLNTMSWGMRYAVLVFSALFIHIAYYHYNTEFSGTTEKKELLKTCLIYAATMIILPFLIAVFILNFVDLSEGEWLLALGVMCASSVFLHYKYKQIDVWTNEDIAYDKEIEHRKKKLQLCLNEDLKQLNERIKKESRYGMFLQLNDKLDFADAQNKKD